MEVETIMASKDLCLYNTITNQKENLKPINPGKIGMYVCGVALHSYDSLNLHEARTSVAFDVLYRYLRYLGYQVNYVRSLGDLNNMLFLKAEFHRENPVDYSSRLRKQYLADMNALQCLLPTHEPRVSDHVEHIINIIIKVIEKGYGYQVGGDVFFSVHKSPNYGQLLSSQSLAGNRVSGRVALLDLKKRNPADFALWKAAKPGEEEPSWESPWGLGRPGLHVECRAMSTLYLPPRFDIHGGTANLKFPHHENVIAQTCCEEDSSGANFWLHSEQVIYNDDHKLQRHGRYITIGEMMVVFHPLAVRYFLMSVHYRTSLTYTKHELEVSSDSLYNVYQTLQDLVEALAPYQEALKDKNRKYYKQTSEAQDAIKKLWRDFEEKMSDDLNSPHILRDALPRTMKLIKVLITKLKKKTKRMSLVVSLVELEKAARGILDVLGLLTSLSYEELLKEMKQKALGRGKLGEEEVLQLIEERKTRRDLKDFERSDKIRAWLKSRGISLMDIPGGKDTLWRPSFLFSPQPKPGK
ncbi:hypothetical protein Rs2_37046 [Raphanus sativus]|uniref:cysteine--tRNA ligase n=1 Tax=Raphanus sativus TaxID=3726 RepID=A0A6J0KTE9_RAPSA|nr:cysteine--tRNA ligase 2, cytoplasmic-like [Raphanus sativus]XP_056847535.1 cysteine--tRNA ligase 2, cytoplasmic-like [Raphanus sativus]KAJ4879992.1 hypothetical protein Rs2_37046 [Raphanus sativus]